MPIVLGFVVVVAIIYGAVALYMAVAAAFGWLAGIGADVLAVALIAAIIAGFVHRYRSIHGVNVKGERNLSLEDAWGRIEIHANDKRGSLVVNGREARFIFADISAVQVVNHDGTWGVALRLDHNAQAEWEIPMKDRKQARRWAKILSLAAAQKL